MSVRRLLFFLTLLLLACGDRAAGAEEDLGLLEERAFRAAAQRVAESVVRIETLGGLQRVESVLFGSGPTTGLVVGSDGYVLSSAFAFLNQPSSILVQLPDGSRHAARLVATDHNRMVALLKIDVDRPLPAPEAVPRDQMRVGQWAVAAGRTFDSAQLNLSVGILSALGRIWGKAIQTDSAASPNNYGGPLVDLRGRVLGLLVPLSPQQGEQLAGVEWYDSGIGFAVPLCDLVEILPMLKQGKDLFPGVIGIRFPQSTLYTAPPVISAVRRWSPADEAGLKAKDRIVEIDGRRIVRPVEVKEEIGRRYAGQTIHVVAMRASERIERDIELVARLEPYVPPFLGILPIRTVEGERGREGEGENNTQTGTDGVTVRYVYPGSPAATAGIKPGDTIVHILDEPAPSSPPLPLSPSPALSPDDLRRQIADRRPGEQVELEIRRGAATEKRLLKLARLPEELPPKSLPPAWETRNPKSEIPKSPSPPNPVPPDAAGGLGPQPPTLNPQSSTFHLKIPEFENDAWAYVPENYDPAVPHGVVVWLHAPGKADAEAAIARWKPHCRRDHLILVAPLAADPNHWRTGEIELVVRLLGEVQSAYNVDPARVLVGGQEAGGTLAYLVAFRNRDLVRAVAAVDAPLDHRPPEYEPGQPLAVYSASAGKSRFAGSIDDGANRLRAGNYPVTVKPLGEAPRPLDDDELAELARWIDMLDRI